ncbi:hypothetical protein B0T36_05795 [Nocardia donostiensis]|uniref:YdcF family protein n=1 Tax=Nocardia donostiensis TaxID=1538463 RepID=UPI0009DB2813|nr:YdcF family protein [Nocardia donostiensis]OQS16277.1 hypothetical protein B0T36_05795 [Nocardia donostiensis]
MFDTSRSPIRPRTAAGSRRAPRAIQLAAYAVFGAAAFTTAATAWPAAPAAAVPSGSAEVASGPLTRIHGPGTVIVVLGHGLLPDGRMRPELVARLHAGYVQALLAPASPVIVTGGNPCNGVTEAAAMAEWLVRHGIPPHRILQEGASGTTVENAELSARLMHHIGAREAVVVTSSNHIGRAVANFVAAGVPVAAAVTPEHLPDLTWAFGPGW